MGLSRFVNLMGKVITVPRLAMNRPAQVYRQDACTTASLQARCLYHKAILLANRLRSLK